MVYNGIRKLASRLSYTRSNSYSCTNPYSCTGGYADSRADTYPCPYAYYHTYSTTRVYGYAYAGTHCHTYAGTHCHAYASNNAKRGARLDQGLGGLGQWAVPQTNRRRCGT